MFVSTVILQSTLSVPSPFQPLHAPSLPKSSLLPCFCTAGRATLLSRLLSSAPGNRPIRPNKLYAVTVSLIESPLIWAGRLCVFYALLKSGLAGSDANPLVSELGSGAVRADSDSGDLGFSELLRSLRGRNADKEAADKRKLVSKWHPTTKGTLRRNYRVPSKSEGRRLLKGIASLLSDDDHFRDATSHKGCQIRRESAHGESVCCNNVRALFDELPTPHLIVEITPFPAGPLTDNDYAKAEKLERVLRSGPSI